MAVYVKKGTFGYKEEPEHEATHVVMSIAEYNAMQEQMEVLEIEKKMAMEDAKHFLKIERMKFEDKCEQCKLVVDEEVEMAKKEAADLVKEAQEKGDVYQRLNANLIRICKERANAERNLRPKKEHTGYVVISSQEKEIRYQDKRIWKNAVVWETVLQSPYGIEFTEEQARTMITGEVLSNEGGWKLGAVGISSCFMTNFENLVSKCPEEIKTQNIAFNERLRANYKAGYWEYIVLHTLPLGQVPKDMLP